MTVSPTAARAATTAPERLWARLQRFARPRRPEEVPIRIDRSRIYVLPTGFGLFIAVLLGVMVLGALNYNNNPALLLGFLLAAVVINSLLQSHLVLSGIELRAVHAATVHAGGTATVRCLLQASGHRRRPLLRLESQAAFDLVGEQAREIYLPMSTAQRGWLDLPRLRLETRHPYGFAIAWSWLWPRHRVLVYPHPESAPPPLPQDGGGGKQRPRDPSEGDLRQMRGYRPGDPPRRIAWKSSARHDRLLVREFELPAGELVRLDWNATASLSYERRISRLTRWVLDAERAGLNYALHLPGRALGPDRGARHAHRCLRALALMPRD